MVSILIPVFNREKYIKETIESARGQSYSNIEIIIVDNCSTDNTWQIIKDEAKLDSRIRYFRNSDNIGPVKNWKRCIEKARGEYTKILWSDDLIGVDFLTKTVPILDKNSDVGFVFTGTEIFYEDGKRMLSYNIGETGIYSSHKYIDGVLFKGNFPVSPGCGLFRTEDITSNLLIEVPNRVNSRFSKHAIGNDLLLFLITANHYKNFGFIKDTLSYFRAHANSISISSKPCYRVLNYCIAKAYFVETYRKDLIKKFNTELKIILLRCINNKMGINSVKDFYSANNTISINYLYFFIGIAKKILKILRIKK
ncbi:MAG: glycosyltransferase [Spirochaetales bacterium]|nr:glycosyltransferase [Spirochaetales bacterium]